ncbi:hypothetical protein M2140_000403 [Clostridiales Family XIII bacterium PM5-7]
MSEEREKGIIRKLMKEQNITISEASSDEEFHKKIKKANDDLVTKKLTHMLKARANETRLLEKIKAAYLDDDEAGFNKFVQSYSIESERNFLLGKTLRQYKMTDKTFLSELEIEEQGAPMDKGECDYFEADAEKINDDYFTFTLPQLLPTRNRSKGYWQGHFIYYVVHNLNMKLREKGKINRRKFNQATLVFEHHIDTTTNSKVYPDADNLEAKIVTDAFQLFFICNDTLRDINTLHIGKADSKNYTKVHIINQPYMQKWLAENADLFYEK